ncbi:MAG TPA: SpoIIE family protein phosphatase [Leptospiraceae bacterium]|nr:SpoIIE family protein phosphatase [Leptospiraceae bacterium]HRG74371.1 SpoIIE family protein phosphatase [Leptospiraceae bacterium]
MKIGIEKKINSILFLSLLAVGLSIGVTFFFKQNDYMMKSVIDKLYNGLFSIYNIVDMESLPNLNKKSSQSQEYIQNWKKIKNIQKELGLASIYIVLMNERSQFYFVYDSGDDPTTKQPHDNFFKEYKDPPSEAFEAFTSGKMVSIKGQYSNQFGTFKSGFYPINVNGKIIGFIGADCNIANILELKKESLLIIGLFLFLGLIIVMLAGRVIKQWIVTPINELNYGIRKIANGNLNYSISLNENNEIGELVTSINTMTRNLKTNFTTIQKHNKQLEERIEERTNELKETLSEVQELRIQQEGDYFLTTLIAEHLMQNRNKSPYIKIDFLTEQKKKFQFKGKTRHLGGDISIAGNLNFLGKKFTMFFNGDAMGKSMQGAGGALVIGSLVNSIMSRSAANKRVITKESDRWLRETFFEIQKVMEAFDGTMFVSCILGVIEDETGLLQFFNAEHPLSIVYRDGKANFIEDGITAHKLGMPFNVDVGLIQFQLQPGDVIFCGSDGKDDLILNKGSSGTRIINENQKLFLKIIEISEGQLDKIYSNLVNTGELSDDLSIVRISFKENS